MAAPPRIFSGRRRIARFERAVSRQKAHDPARFLFEAIAEDIGERLSFMRLEPARSLVHGDPSGLAAKTLRSLGGEVVEAPLGSFDEELPMPHVVTGGDGFDCIASILALDTVNDLPGALLHLRAALAPGGIAFVAAPAAGSLPQLRAAMLAADGERPAPRLHPAIDAASGVALLQRAGFGRAVADTIPLNVSYATMDRLVGDLRDMGVTSVLETKVPPLTREALATARAAFSTQRNSEDRTIETFEIAFLTGWKD